MKEFSLRVEESDSKMRLDLYLIKNALKKKLGISRTSIQKLILDSKVTLNDKPIKSHHRVKPGELFKIKIEEPKPYNAEPEQMPLDIVYQDSDLAAVNKPSGMVVHPACGNYRHTLVNALLYHFKNLSHLHPQRPGIVHRLDKDTSGILVVAKNDKTHLALAKQFAKHSIRRQYVALVKGKMEFDEDVIDLPIGRDPKNWKKMSIDFGKRENMPRLITGH